METSTPGPDVLLAGRHDGTAVPRLNRPERLNAIERETRNRVIATAGAAAARDAWSRR